jgi:acyl-CoA thioester hydrolase
MPFDPADRILTPLTLQTMTVRPEWIDYNGHMRDGYYALAFSFITDAFLDYVGLDTLYRARSGCALYTLEMHLNFLRELRADVGLRFTTQLLGFDVKRLQLFHSMYHSEQGYLAATNEVMLLHVDAQPRAAPMPAEVLERVEQVAAAHAALTRPFQAGRSIIQLDRSHVMDFDKRDQQSGQSG